jgi:hypothetical protein
VGVNRPGHEADHSPPSSSEVKKAWSLVKHRDKSTPITIINQIRLHAVLKHTGLRDDDDDDDNAPAPALQIPTGLY